MPGPDPEIPDSVVLQFVVLHPEPVVTSADFLGHFDLTRQAINKRLNALVNEGYLDARKVGSAAKIYWITQKGREKVAADSSWDDHSSASQ